VKVFKFKLEAVLKMRRLKEDQCKMEIGRIQIRIRTLQGFLDEQGRSIGESYDAQEQALGGGMDGREIQFHPFFVSGKRANMDQIRAEMKTLDAEVKEKYQDLAKLRAQVKVIDEMKTDQKSKHRKHIQKKQFAEIEEQVQNWKQAVKQDL
jgi:flagellar export protein FliJ